MPTLVPRDDTRPHDASEQAFIDEINRIIDRLLSPGRLGTTAGAAVRVLDACVDDLKAWPSIESGQRCLERLLALREELAASDPDDTPDRVRSHWRRGAIRRLGTITVPEWDGTEHRMEIDELNAKPLIIEALEGIEREPNPARKRLLATAAKHMLDLVGPPRRGRLPGEDDQ